MSKFKVGDLVKWENFDGIGYAIVVGHRDGGLPSLSGSLVNYVFICYYNTGDTFATPSEVYGRNWHILNRNLTLVSPGPTDNPKVPNG
jgi:hypothetical protein